MKINLSRFQTTKCSDIQSKEGDDDELIILNTSYLFSESLQQQQIKFVIKISLLLFHPTPHSCYDTALVIGIFSIGYHSLI
jgi:hypothetical protein